MTSRLEDLVDNAVTLPRGERKDFGGQEKDEADKSSGFHDEDVDMSPILCQIGILAGDSDTMILSSADILRILGGNEIVRLSAKLGITDGRPGLSGREGIYIYVERFPVAEEFEATWSIYIESDEEIDLVVAEIRRLLPKVQVERGLLTVVKTTDFRSESTQTAPEAPRSKTTQVDLTQYEERFQSLVEDVQDQMLLVSSGRPGRDGKDGRDGASGRDGRDIEATQTELFDLKDVNSSPIPLEKGQVLTWDGEKWTNLFVRTSSSIIGGGNSGGGGGTSDVEVLNDLNDVTTDQVQGGQFLQYNGSSGQWEPASIAPGGGIPEAPMDGDFYVRQNAQWVNLKDALSQLGVPVDEPIDGGNFTTGFSAATSNTPADGGNFTTGTSSAQHSITLDGGNYTTGQTAADEFSAFGL